MKDFSINQECLTNMYKFLENNHISDKVLVWGANFRSDLILSDFKKHGIEIVGLIDNDAIAISEYKGYHVFAPCKLFEERYFVYVSQKGDCYDIAETLESYGYKEFKDYWYPRRCVKLDGTTDYHDLYGNRLITNNETPIKVELKNGSRVEINAGNLDRTTKVLAEHEANIIIGENIETEQGVTISSTNGTITLGENTFYGAFSMVRTSSGGTIKIGSGSSIQVYTTVFASFGARVILDDDCMVSYNVCIRAGNSHSIIDLDTLENLDDNENRDIILGKHVWVGMYVTLLNGVEIGSGTVIGANAFVCKKKFKENCCVAGNPARVIRERVAWMKNGDFLRTDIEDYSNYIFE